MARAGQVVARRMTPGKPNHVRHIKELKWQPSDGPLMWSSRAEMVSRVRSNPHTFFVEGGGMTAWLYVVDEGSDSWVETMPDKTKADNLLYLPEE